MIREELRSVKCHPLILGWHMRFNQPVTHMSEVVQGVDIRVQWNIRCVDEMG
jgi:hypothetical protein